MAKTVYLETTYININGIEWDKDDPRLPKDLVAEIDLKIYNDLNSDNHKRVRKAEDEVIKRIEEVCGVDGPKIVKIGLGWSDWEPNLLIYR